MVFDTYILCQGHFYFWAMEAVLQGSTCIHLFMYWLRNGRTELCSILVQPLETVYATLLPWAFSGKGAVGTLFKHGGDFPYKITGSFAHLHGTRLDKKILAFFCARLREYSMHPPALLAPMAILQHTVHEARLRARVAELRAQGVLAFYQKMCVLEQGGSIMRCAALDTLIAEFEIVTSKSARTHLIPLTAAGKPTAYVTRWDAAILRLFI